MATGEGSAATIGKSVQIHGEVKGSEDLVVDGTIEGTITLSESRLTIGPNAHVKANVAARDVILLGALVGDISATGRGRRQSHHPLQHLCLARPRFMHSDVTRQRNFSRDCKDN